MPEVGCVRGPGLLRAVSSVAGVVAGVLPTCIWVWSYVIVSGQCGWYQKVRLGLPVGTVTVCVSVLFPFTALVEPMRAALVPVWPPGAITGKNAPPPVQGDRVPVSTPGFWTRSGAAT